MASLDSDNAQEIVSMNREYTFFSWSVQSAVNPIPMARAEGVYFWDADGKRYIDFSSQLMNVNIGHQHPKVVRAIQEQAAQLCFAHPGMATEPRGLLGKKIAAGRTRRSEEDLLLPGRRGSQRERHQDRPLVHRAASRSWPATAPITAPPMARSP